MTREEGRQNWLVAIRMRQFGDVIATLESLRALKRHDPNRRIAYVVDRVYHELLEPLDYIDRLVPSPPRGGGLTALRKYARYVAELRALSPQVVLDFHGNPRSALLTWLIGAPTRVGFDVRLRRRAYTVVEPRAYFEDGRRVPQTSLASAVSLASHVGATSDGELPEIPVSDETLARGRELLIAAGLPAASVDNGELVGLNPGRRYQAKEWPPDRFAALARRLEARGLRPVVLWGPGEEETAGAVCELAGSAATLAPAVTLAELPGLLRHLRMLVTIDSGLKHIAVCVGVPTVTLFGSTSPLEWHMGRAVDAVLWKGLSCSPCRRLDCPFGAPCMDHDVDAVYRTVESVEAQVQS